MPYYRSRFLIQLSGKNGVLKPSRAVRTESKVPFAPISRTKSLVERAKEQLEALIVEGSLSPGELLPPERKLGDMLGVSRTVVREAVRSLTARGLLEVRPGSGTFVRALGPGIFHDSMDLLVRAKRLGAEQIYEVRRVLEITVAGLAAERAGADEVAALEAEVAALRQENAPAAEYAQHDFRFHMRLAESTHNALFLAFVNSVSVITIRTMQRMYAAGSHKTPFWRFTLVEHSAILDHIRQRDAEGARRAMAGHMDQALKRLKEVKMVERPQSSDSLE